MNGMISNRRIVWLRFAIIALVFLGGCAAGPDFKRPAPPVATGYSPKPMVNYTVSADALGGVSQHFDPKKDIPYDWWELFKSTELNNLVEQAFKANPDIKAVQAALHQAQEYVAAQQGYFYPTIGANYSFSRTKLAGNNGGNAPGIQNNGDNLQTYSNPSGPAPYNGPIYYNYHTAQFTVGFVPDVFGLNRRQVESLQAQADIQRFQLEASYITLASNVVAAAIQEASLRAQIAAMEKVVSINKENLAIMQAQEKQGYLSELVVSAQVSALSQSEQALIPMRLQLEQTRDMIRALAGGSPDKDVPETFRLSELQLPQELPLSLPSKLVEQRPDVRAAEEQLHAASAQYGVSIANLMPQFSIAGDVGGMAPTPGWMFKGGGGFFDLASNVAYTIFDGGTLRAQSRAARDAMTQAGAQYRSTVIAALQNVADTLHAIQSDAAALQEASKNEQAMLKARDMMRVQYETGYVSYQTLLAADQNYQQSIITLSQAQANRFGDTAALYQALGGGWWNRNNNKVK